MNTNLPEITKLIKYNNSFHAKKHLPKCCFLCGSIALKKNGTYTRKTHAGNSQTIYPVLIQRILCLECKHTFSVLPEWLPPRRWYVWAIQEKSLLALLLSTSIRMVSKQYKIARSTLRRWLNRFREQFEVHADQLKQLLPNILGRTNDFVSFWRTCLAQCTLAQAMGYLHNTGIKIP
jgi:transposase-like protein